MKYQSDNPTDDKDDSTVSTLKDNKDLKYQSDNLTDDSDNTVTALKDNNNLVQYYHDLYGSEIVFI